MSGSFPPILHKTIRKYIQYSLIVVSCLDEKYLAQNCSAPQKDRFLCQTRQKAQEYWICIPSIFNAVWRKKILFEAIGIPNLKALNAEAEY